MRHFDCRIGLLNQAHFAADPIEAWRSAMLQPTCGEQLHPDANAEKRRSAHVHAFRHRIHQTID